MGHLNFQPLTQGVDHRRADPVQAARRLVSAFTCKLAAGMQNRKNNLQGIHAAFMHACRHAAAVILYRAGSVFFQGNADFSAVPVDCFVNGIVHDFPDQMMKAAAVRRTDIHARTFADRFQAFQNLNTAVIIALCFCHSNLLVNRQYYTKNYHPLLTVKSRPASAPIPSNTIVSGLMRQPQ